MKTVNYKFLEEIRATLRECYTYFDERADADMPPEHARPIPNEEMQLLTEVSEALNKVEGVMKND
jgi:hypothetical protein